MKDQTARLKTQFNEHARSHHIVPLVTSLKNVSTQPDLTQLTNATNGMMND